MWSFFSRDPTKDFNFDIGEVIGLDDKSVWTLRRGKKKVRITSRIVKKYCSSIVYFYREPTKKLRSSFTTLNKVMRRN